MALLSYDGRIHWGFTADYELVPDLPRFLEAVAASFAELAHVAGVKLEDAPLRVDAPAPGAGEHLH
jgi:hypothetical protein